VISTAYSRPLSKNSKIKIYKTIIVPIVLYGRETWSLTLREEHRFGMFGIKLLRGIFGSKMMEVAWGWKGTMRSIITGTHHQILLG
jgi:hypothetical protein